MARLNRTYIILERYKKKPKLIPAPRDRRKSIALAKKLSGRIDDVAWIADNTCCLFKGGEARIREVI